MTAVTADWKPSNREILIRQDARIEALEAKVEFLRKAIVLLCSHQTYEALELVRENKHERY